MGSSAEGQRQRSPLLPRSFPGPLRLPRNDPGTQLSVFPLQTATTLCILPRFSPLMPAHELGSEASPPFLHFSVWGFSCQTLQTQEQCESFENLPTFLLSMKPATVSPQLASMASRSGGRRPGFSTRGSCDPVCVPQPLYLQSLLQEKKK